MQHSGAPVVHAPHGKAQIQMQRDIIASLFPIRPSITDWNDPRACRMHLAGLCCSDMFLNTKVIVQPCNKEHDAQLKARYDAAVAGGAPNFNGELLSYLEELLRRNDHDMARNVARFETEAPGTAVPVVETERVPAVEELAREIAAKVAAEGFNEDAVALTRELHLAQARAARLAPLPHPSGRPAHPKYRQCSACKNILILTDADERMADHFKGRIHMGYKQIAERVEELRKGRR
jgi:hypothetical protein